MEKWFDAVGSEWLGLELSGESWNNYDETKNNFIKIGIVQIKDLPEYQNWPDLMAQAADHVADIRPVHWIDRLPSELVPSVVGHPNDPLEPVHNDLCDYDHD